ncbi:hypothetical protein GGTG_13875 [Gaeumannomyces tritici R3-111a-1]|uniref:Uncharacterized protein n=1 Tax=Gaeumannomyces tritici (strain R3-111a-1) TaxID=644352 RepID=J3PK28_GAET3|nr:hypothetical protein GGTG_13875 [Gaeumannomyces tritici R3-111a-1]EJT68553.1 hypothetical protein GGTG_13875 [Gaeumannomyces tritici R3-111a-1]
MAEGISTVYYREKQKQAILTALLKVNSTKSNEVNALAITGKSKSKQFYFSN